MEIYDFKATSIDHKEVDFKKYKNKTLLIVNVASKCGFTNQYEGLENLYKIYKDKGLEILAFPCNQFGSQEPNNDKQIKNFCSLTYGVSFDMFAKIEVNGENAHPLYKYLKKEKSGILGTELIKWNFTKFLIDKNGNIIGRFAPKTTPKELEEEIKSII